MSTPTRTGSISSSPIAATSTDQLKNGTRPRRMPGARVVRTVVARASDTAARPTTSSTWAARKRSTIFASPPPGPPLAASDTITSTSPLSHVQNPAAATFGNASERAPTCRGTIASAMPSSSGASTPNTSPMRKATNSWGSAPASKRESDPDTRSRPSSTPTTAVAARASSEQPIILMPVTLESADVNHAAVAATPPVPAATSVPGGDVAMESGRRSVVLIRGAGGGGAGQRRSSGAGRTLPVGPRATRNRPGRTVRAEVLERPNDRAPRAERAHDPAPSRQHQDVDREGEEQHRDVGDAVGEHLHAGGRRRDARERERGEEEPRTQHHGGGQVDPAEIGDRGQHERAGDEGDGVADHLAGCLGDGGDGREHRHVGGPVVVGVADRQGPEVRGRPAEHGEEQDHRRPAQRIGHGRPPDEHRNRPGGPADHVVVTPVALQPERVDADVEGGRGRGEDRRQ